MSARSSEWCLKSTRRAPEFGPLQLAIWNKHLQSLRESNRLFSVSDRVFFYVRGRVLQTIKRNYGIDLPSGTGTATLSAGGTTAGDNACARLR